MLHEVNARTLVGLPDADGFSAFTFPQSVFAEQQAGHIFTDNDAQPQVVFVAHKSGFSYLSVAKEFGAYKELLQFFIDEPNLLPYFHVCDAPEALINALTEFPEIGFKLRKRMRMLHKSNKENHQLSANTYIRTEEISSKNIADVSKLNGSLLLNYWASDGDFLMDSFGVLIYEANAPVAICYSACTVQGLAEVDIYTHPDHQGKGLGKIATHCFIQQCNDRNNTPMWDAFTDNTASINLALKTGFVPFKEYNCLSLYFKNRANEHK